MDWRGRWLWNRMAAVLLASFVTVSAIAGGQAQNMHPDWAPDGMRIVFESTRDS